jgi:hypothetical protein
MHYDTREHLFNQVRWLIKRKFRPDVGISPSKYTPVHSRWCPAGAWLFLIYRAPVVSLPVPASNDAVPLPVASDAHCRQMPRSRATCTWDFPLLCTNCTASSLNSFVKVRCSFGIMPSLWRLSSKFISSGEVSQCQSTRLARVGCRSPFLRGRPVVPG